MFDVILLMGRNMSNDFKEVKEGAKVKVGVKGLPIAVAGSNGLLGREVVRVFKKERDVVELPHDRLDISNLAQVRETLLGNPPAVFINCAAYTAVDKAEEEKERANLVNGLGIRNLALACKELDIPLLHISTDYVFNGEKDKPWGIFDTRDPINAYGYSKYLGERYLESINPKYYLVRTSWLFGSGGVNFVSTILRAAKATGIASGKRPVRLSYLCRGPGGSYFRIGKDRHLRGLSHH